MAIVTISRELGSDGTKVATMLCEQLGCPLLDKRSVEEQLREFGISSATVERYDEKKPGFWDRISSDKTRYEHFLRASILETARAGDTVMLGRGGQVILETVPGVIHVRVTAPRKVRRGRIMRRFECGEEQASRIMRQSDQDRAGFHRFFFGSDWAAPALYDVVVSTAKLSADQVVQGILDVTPHGPFVKSDGGQLPILIDRCLEMRVRTLLVYQERMTIPALSVQAENGVVTLYGEVLYEALVDEAAELVGKLDDVQDVDNQLVYNRYPSPPRYG